MACNISPYHTFCCFFFCFCRLTFFILFYFFAYLYSILYASLPRGFFYSQSKKQKNYENEIAIYSWSQIADVVRERKAGKQISLNRSKKNVDRKNKQELKFLFCCDFVWLAFTPSFRIFLSFILHVEIAISLRFIYTIFLCNFLFFCLL